MILLSGSVGLRLGFYNCRIGRGVVPDALCIVVLLLVETVTGANVNLKVLLHFMQCVMDSLNMTLLNSIRCPSF